MQTALLLTLFVMWTGVGVVLFLYAVARLLKARDKAKLDKPEKE